MDRRRFLGGAFGAAVGVLALHRGIGLPALPPEGVHGRQVDATPMHAATLGAMPVRAHPLPPLAARDTNGDVAFGEMTLVTGPDPDTMVHIRFDDAENATVVPPGMETPNETARMWAIPRTLFPEYDPAHGIVPLPMFEWSHSGDDDLALLRASYLHALGQRQPDRPLDGNHLALSFLPRTPHPIFVTLNGTQALGVKESYDGPNGWVIQAVGADTRNVVYDDPSTPYHLVTGNVQHWMDGKTFWPGDHTAPLLR